MENTSEVKVEIGGKELFIGTGMVAKQASGAAMVRYGDNVVLVTATHSQTETNRDYFPLSVEFEQRMYAAGKFPGGFLKRESRPPEDAIISARLVDRTIRPLFPMEYKYEVQVVCMALSSDMENPLDLSGLIGASVALSISDIPFEKPVGGVRIGRVDGKLVINPTFEQLIAGDMDIVFAGTEDAVMMVEGEAVEITEEEFLEALDLAHIEIRKIIEAQKEIIAKVAKEKMTYDVREKDTETIAKAIEFAAPLFKESMDGKDKVTRETMAREAINEAIEKFSVNEEGEKDETLAKDLYEALDHAEYAVMREKIWDTGLRADGRKLDEIRPISCAVGLLPRTHGSGLFTRGQTQVLSIVTLGSIGDAQRIDTISEDSTRPYIHHYNFPPFSVGEVRMMRGPSRRDIGHGNLAERALKNMIPDDDNFKYAIRVVSEVLESNGSSSMASVCGSTLSLMDAGVNIKKPVAGIAMGLIVGDSIDDYKILTDIQGLEDHHGDMDFKVAGTSDGITAVQMDIKVKGITSEIMEKALAQAKEARLFILGKIKETISEARSEMSPYAPKIQTVKIDVDKIGTVIGPGGKMIRSIVEETGAQIDIEEDGTVLIYSRDAASGELAKKRITDLTEDAVVGKIYDGEVKRIVSFGAFIEILPGVDGLVHISQLADHRVEKVEDVINIGDKVKVKVREIDDMGRVNLTMDLEGPGFAGGGGGGGGKPSGDRPPRRDDRRGGGGSRGGYDKNRNDRR